MSKVIIIDLDPIYDKKPSEETIIYLKYYLKICELEFREVEIENGEIQ